jgi:hypothetical protein
MVTWRQRLAEWYWRWIDYRLRERHLSPLARALTRHWQVFTTRVARVMEVAHARVDIYRQEADRMDETPVAPLPPATLGRLLLSRLDRESAQAIAAAVAEEIRNEVVERCLEEVRSEHAAALQHRLEKLALT